MLWFWTPWCPFCNQEAPNVAAVSAANPAVTFVGVATRADVPALQGFVSKYNLNFTNINDADGLGLGTVQRALAAGVRLAAGWILVFRQ